MCKIITILNKNPNNLEIINKILTANEDDLAMEKDGYSVYRDGNPFYFMGYKHIHNNIAYKGEKLYMSHFRTASSGEKGPNGLHLQRLNNRYIFAHNGMVSKYSVKTYSDSYFFFRDLIKKPVNKDRVKKMLKDTNFWGKGFLYDEIDNKLHVFSNTSLYIYGLPDCLIITTYELTKKVSSFKYISVLGYQAIEDNDEEIKFLFEETEMDKYLVFENMVNTKIEDIAETNYLPYKYDDDRPDWWKKDDDKGEKLSFGGGEN